MENDVLEIESHVPQEKLAKLRELYSNDPAKYVEQLKLEAGISPPPPVEKKIGGWLYLIAIGLVANPFVVLSVMFKDLLPALKPETIKLMSTQGTVYYNPGLLNLIYFESGFYLVLLIAYIYLLTAFFRKQRNFPPVFMVIYLVNMAFIIFDTFAVHLITQSSGVYPSELSFVSIIWQAVVCAIWVPYMILSVRVKETFVKD